jgi:hypothetical protein
MEATIWGAAFIYDFHRMYFRAKALASFEVSA